MRCSEFEIRLCEYLDGSLEEALGRQLDEHAAECTACAGALADSRALARFLERVPAVEAPEALVTDILYRTQKGSRAWRSGARGWRGRLAGLLQPRFAMSMAMTILSVSMLYSLTGAQMRHPVVADLNPLRIWRSVDERVQRGWQRATQIYQSLRLLYEVQSQAPPAEDSSSEDSRPEEGQP